MRKFENVDIINSLRRIQSITKMIFFLMLIQYIRQR